MRNEKRWKEEKKTERERERGEKRGKVEEHAATVTTVAAMPTLIMTKEDRTMILKRARVFLGATYYNFYTRHNNEICSQRRRNRRTNIGSNVEWAHFQFDVVCSRRSIVLSSLVSFFFQSPCLALEYFRTKILYFNKNKCNNFWYSVLASWSLGSPHILHLSLDHRKCYGRIDGDNQIIWTHQQTKITTKIHNSFLFLDFFMKKTVNGNAFLVRFLSRDITYFDTPITILMRRHSKWAAQTFHNLEIFLQSLIFTVWLIFEQKMYEFLIRKWTNSQLSHGVLKKF